MTLRRKLSQQLDALMLDIAGQKIQHETVPEFRVSGFPYCPIRHLLFTGRTESYSMDFYTGIGTAVHNTIQKWAIVSGFKDKIFCCWRAKETDEVYGPCYFKDLPKSWGNYTILYEEITIKYRGLSGHVDLVVEILPGKFFVIDFKTTDLQGKKYKNPIGWRDSYPASANSIIQITTYCTLLKKLYGLNIVGYCLIYVDRGKVIKTNHDYHKYLRPWNKAKHKHLIKFIDEACANNKRLVKLRKILDESEGYSETGSKLLKKLILNRPCVDQESYDQWMAYKFSDYDNNPEHGTKKGQCIMKDACLKSDKACLKLVQAKL